MGRKFLHICFKIMRVRALKGTCSLVGVGLIFFLIKGGVEAQEYPPLSPQALEHFHTADALQKQGDLAGAVREYQQAIALTPDRADLHYNLGIALYLQGDERGAITELHRAIALNLTYADAHVYLGTIFHHRSDFDGAIAEYREALRIDPTHAGARTNLGVALKNKRDLDGAIEEYQQALGLNPQSTAARRNLDIALREQAGRQSPPEMSSTEQPETDQPAESPVQAQEKENGGAKEPDRTLVRLSEAPTEAETLPVATSEDNPASSSVHVPQDEPEAKKATPQASLSLPPKKEEEQAFSFVAIVTRNQEALFHYEVGQALEARGDLVRAKREYQEAQKYDPNFAAACCSLGLVWEKAGDKKNAAVQLTRCLQLAPENPQAPLIRERLAQLGYPQGNPPIQ